MEFKDYYAILEIDRQSSSDEIKAAYRLLSKKWHPDLNPGRDVTKKMQDINEAYAILKNPDKKARYDYEYDNYYRTEQAKQEEKQRTESRQEYKVHNEDLKQDINEARKYAEVLVAEFFKSLKETSKVAAKGALNEAKGYVIAGIIMSIIASIIMTCSG